MPAVARVAIAKVASAAKAAKAKSVHAPGASGKAGGSAGAGAGSAKAKASTNCGSGAGGFKPGNICGGKKRAAHAANLRNARAAARAGKADAGEVRRAALALKAHRRGTAGKELDREGLKAVVATHKGVIAKHGGFKPDPKVVVGQAAPKGSEVAKVVPKGAPKPEVNSDPKSITQAHHADLKERFPHHTISGDQVADFLKGSKIPEVSHHMTFEDAHAKISKNGLRDEAEKVGAFGPGFYTSHVADDSYGNKAITVAVNSKNPYVSNYKDAHEEIKKIRDEKGLDPVDGNKEAAKIFAGRLRDKGHDAMVLDVSSHKWTIVLDPKAARIVSGPEHAPKRSITTDRSLAKDLYEDHGLKHDGKRERELTPDPKVGSKSGSSSHGLPAKKPHEHTDHEPGHVGYLNTDLIHADPARFQFKEHADAKTGSVNSLDGAESYDQNLGGILQVWKDPADGIVNVVNGHNRLAKAKEKGVDKVAVRFLDASDAREARSIGALTNIAEGNGTPLDAAKFFRDTGLGMADIKARGLVLKKRTAADGAALSTLSDHAFEKVRRGHISQDQGAIIGSAGLSHAHQDGVVKILDEAAKRSRSGTVTDNHLREIVDEFRHAPVVKKVTKTLFGDDEEDLSLGLHKTKLSAIVKEKLASDKRLFKLVAKSKNASNLARGGNTIDTEASGKIGQEAAETLDIFDRLKTLHGPVSRHLNAGAERIHNGEKAAKVYSETYRTIVDDLSSMIREGRAFH
jgi:hypothetical protein